MMTDKIIMGLIFFLVVLIVVAVVLYSLFGEKDDSTSISFVIEFIVAAPTPAPFFRMIAESIQRTHMRT